MNPSWILLFSCPDVAGVQAFVSTFIFKQGGFIDEVKAYSDTESGVFVSRIAFHVEDDSAFSYDDFTQSFAAEGTDFDLDWTLTPASQKLPTIIAVSKFGHCLNDLLHRWKIGALPIDIKAIVSNHETMRPMAQFYGLPYHHIPITKNTKMESEAQFLKVIEENGAQLTILARYMQVLSDGFAAKLSRKCINIHHSFLPSFKGAKPYH